jgi:anti-sigma B factor antagonist
MVHPSLSRSDDVTAVPARESAVSIDPARADPWLNARAYDWAPPAPVDDTPEGGPVDLSLETRNEGDWTVIAVGGEIDVYTAPKLREALVELVNAGRYQIIVDVESVDFLDSTGLGVLVGGLKRVRANDGNLRVVCTQERLLKIFRITGLTKVFAIHESVAAATAD